MPKLKSGERIIQKVNKSQGEKMFTLPKLDYTYDGLEPYIDAQTMELHYCKHHQAYIDKLNGALDGSEWADKDIAEIITNLGKLDESKRMVVQNNGGGHYNHSFFWKCMTPGGNSLTGNLLEKIDDQFGNFDKFKQEFAAAAIGRFGSGWVWLVQDGDELKICSMANQDNPLMQDSSLKLLLALDVWEHAYYLKYQNKRPDYVENWWNVVDWDFVSNNLA